MEPQSVWASIVYIDPGAMGQIVTVFRPAVMYLAGAVCGLATVVGVSKWI